MRRDAGSGARGAGRSFAVVTCLALAGYALTLAPGLTWAHDGADGGDFATALATGGIAHPPGYPTYLLAAAPAAALPVGNWRCAQRVFRAVHGVGRGRVGCRGLARRAALAAARRAGLGLCAGGVGQALITEVTRSTRCASPYAVALVVRAPAWLCGAQGLGVKRLICCCVRRW
jgi:hypothetical protein